MNKTQLQDALSAHPGFNADRLFSLSNGKLTNAILWQYLCELENWKPLEVVSTNHPDWVLVASTSEIGLWHHTCVMHQSCDCRYSDHRPVAPCCHLSAAMAHDENQWIAKATSYGFEVTTVDGDGVYRISDKASRQQVGELKFEGSAWWLTEPRKVDSMRFEGVHEAIEYLAAVASFGWQLAQ